MEDTYTKPSGKVHLGRNIARIRELKGMKQETLAEKLGTNQQAVSRLEQKETMDVKKLEEVAEALGVTPEAIKAFNEDAAFTFINSNAFHDNSALNTFTSGNNQNYQPTFNPLDKIIEQSAKIEELYKALLKSEQEKNHALSEANKAVLDLAEEVKKLNFANKREQS
ncbi:MAG: helix-turn-helix domain-containing protein [Mangrovibacterium sp.]